VRDFALFGFSEGYHYRVGKMRRSGRRHRFLHVTRHLIRFEFSLLNLLVYFPALNLLNI